MNEWSSLASEFRPCPSLAQSLCDVYVVIFKSFIWHIRARAFENTFFLSILIIIATKFDFILNNMSIKITIKIIRDFFSLHWFQESIENFSFTSYILMKLNVKCCTHCLILCIDSFHSPVDFKAFFRDDQFNFNGKWSQFIVSAPKANFRLLLYLLLSIYCNEQNNT